MYINFGISSLLLSLALAVPSHFAMRQSGSPRDKMIMARDAANTTNAVRHMIVGAAGQIAGYEFDGTSFKANSRANFSLAGMTASWLAFKEPNILYAVDENTNTTRQFYYCTLSGTLSSPIVAYNGSSGVVHLEFNKNKTRMVGSSYSQGQVDVWSSAPSGMLQLLTQIPLPGEHGPDPVSQTTLRAHQSVLDPSGRFFVVNDLGGDKLHILDSLNDQWKITNSVPVIPAGSGPRHGVFISVKGGQHASHYVVVCEITSTIQLYEVDYLSSTLGLTHTQTLSTFGALFPPANATSARAGEIIVSRAGPAQIYVTNRLTGNETDSISVFALEASSSANGTAQLVWKSAASTGGNAPRHLSLSKRDEKVLFVANPNGKIGLDAVGRASSTVTAASATLENSVFAPGQPVDAGFGPQFIMEF